MKFKSSTTKALRRVKENLKGELHQGTESMLCPLILRKHSDHLGRALQKKEITKMPGCVWARERTAILQ